MSPRGGPRPGGGRPRTGARRSLTIRLPIALDLQVRAAAEDAGISLSEWLARAAAEALGIAPGPSRAPGLGER